MLLVVDHRESQSGVWEYLAALPDVQLKWGNLPTGDYIVDNAAIFERKTASDFASSLIDQRLFSQAKRLADQPLRSGLIIEGRSEDWSMLGVRRESLQGALITLTLIFDLPVSGLGIEKKQLNSLSIPVTNSQGYAKTCPATDSIRRNEDGPSNSISWHRCLR
jgi:ERCC4-type nuclease